jgi:uncharacterized membrane protein
MTMVRGKLMEKGVGRTEDFRWRSHEITRIEGFSDAVFAFAVTLLVVSLEVPKTFDELTGIMQGFIAFALGSALLFVIWYNQYKFFRRYGMQDVWTITLNGALLFVVLFFVYPIKFLFTWLIKTFTGADTTVRLANGVVEHAIRPEQTGSLMTIYGLGYIAVFGIFVLMHFHAYRKREELALSPLEMLETRISIRENAINSVIGLFSVSLVLIGGPAWSAWAGFAYMLVGPAMWIHGSVSSRKRRSITQVRAGG